MLARIVALTCLAAAVSCAAAAPRRHQLAPSASQIVPQAVAAPEAGKPAHQAKLHYVEIGPSLKGDYKFGYDTGSGPTGQSFREETRLDDGTVKGAYGYIDANGKQRIVKYTAGKAGFVVDADQEAPGQASAAQPAQPAQPASAARPQPVAAPQPAQAAFDEAAVAINRAIPQSQLSPEQQHAQQLRQHQLAQQQALSQQQQLAQQQQIQQQQILQQQQLAAQQHQAQQAAAQQHQHQHQHQHQNQHQNQHQHPALHQSARTVPAQAQFPAPQAAPQPPAHQVIDPQNGHFFSSSNDANLNQLLMNQLRQLQSPDQFSAHFGQPAHGPQHLAAQAAPTFQSAAPQFGGQPGQSSLSQPLNAPPADFGHQLRTRQAHPNGFHAPAPAAQAHAPAATPQSALLALHQQQQHDAQILASLRAQQLAQLQQQQRQHQQQQAAQQQVAPQQQAAVEQRQPQLFGQPQPQSQLQQQMAAAPAPQQAQQAQPQPLASGPVAVAPVTQPEVFGPPVIDIRTLNYSIGQQTRVN